MYRTMAALLGVLFVSLFFVQALVWPSPTYAIAMMVVDALAAWVILWHPAGKVQSLIGLTFLLQIGVHTGRILNGVNADLFNYWLGLSLLAFLQLGLVGGWWLYERVRGSSFVRSGGPVSPSPYPPRMGR
jgi:hypothetical protein